MFLGRSFTFCFYKLSLPLALNDHHSCQFVSILFHCFIVSFLLLKSLNCELLIINQIKVSTLKPFSHFRLLILNLSVNSYNCLNNWFYYVHIFNCSHFHNYLFDLFPVILVHLLSYSVMAAGVRWIYVYNCCFVQHFSFIRWFVMNLFAPVVTLSARLLVVVVNAAQLSVMLQSQ